MRLFGQLLQACLQEPKTLQKISLLSDYFNEESPENMPMALHFLMGENMGRFCSGRQLREWAAQLLGLPDWLVDESYEALGDNSETISLLFPNKPSSLAHDLKAVCERIQQLKSEPIDVKKDWIIDVWSKSSRDDIYTFNKLLGGGIRIGASKKNVLKALSRTVHLDVDILEQRLLGTWEPTKIAYDALVNPDDIAGKGTCPYPFFLASPIQDVDATLMPFSDWQIEPKWDGIRAQLVHRQEGTQLWSRGNDLISDQFPDILDSASELPYGVYDGEVLAWGADGPQPFADLQKRLNRKKVTRQLLASIPCIMMLYDCLEFEGVDVREQALHERCKKIRDLRPPFYTSNPLTLNGVSALNDYVKNARNNRVEGVIIKRLSSAYKSGRVRGDWWKLKVDPLLLDVVIMYAQKGKGIRSGLFTDYTFGVWDNNQLVPIGKAYSGLTNDEIKQVHQILNNHLTDRFGPVRGVSPCVVLEVAFDSIQESPRHKSGLALRFPRINRLRLDKPVEEANSLEDARALC